MKEKFVKKIYSTDEKIVYLARMINEEMFNRKLVDSITEEFLKKGLNAKIVSAVFSESISLKDFLEQEKYKYERIAFYIGAYKILQWDALSASKNFTDNELSLYDSYMNIEEQVNSVVFEKAIKLSSSKFNTSLSIKDIAKYENNALWMYPFDSQRKPVTRYIGTEKFKVQEMNVDFKAVEEIKTAMLKDDYEYDPIILNLRIRDDETIPQKIEKEIVKDSGVFKITITPNYDYDSNHYTTLDKIDGQHRILAITQMVAELEKQGEPIPDIQVPVILVYRTPQQAKKIISQIFKRSDTNREYLDAVTENEYTKFADILINNSKILNGKVAIDSDEYFEEEYYTTKMILADTVKKLENIEFGSEILYTNIAKKISRFTDEMINYLCSISFNSLEDMKKNSCLLYRYMFVGYVIIGNYLRNRNDNIELIQKLCDKINEIKDSELMNLKLNQKHQNVNKIENYFISLIREVIENE